MGLRRNGHAKLKKQIELEMETIDLEKEWVLIDARNIMMCQIVKRFTQSFSPLRVKNQAHITQGNWGTLYSLSLTEDSLFVHERYKVH